MRTLHIDTDLILLLIITSTARWPFRGYQHRWPWTTL